MIASPNGKLTNPAIEDIDKMPLVQSKTGIKARHTFLQPQPIYIYNFSISSSSANSTKLR
jgi:hypothetical protein